ncbi:hypothetical protein Lal_00018830 [Lupinus albus]|nr:hypothetical protein Lal_00018830 [Lupinus albus]
MKLPLSMSKDRHSSATIIWYDVGMCIFEISSTNNYRGKDRKSPEMKLQVKGWKVMHHSLKPSTNFNHHPEQHYPSTHSQERTSRKQKIKTLYDAILMSYSELLPQLLQKGLLTIHPFNEVMPPYPNDFNTNSYCMYHGGTS